MTIFFPPQPSGALAYATFLPRALILIAAGTAPAAFAADQSSDPASNPGSMSNQTAAIETMVVRGHRTPIDVERAASSVSARDRAAIEARQSLFAADLLRDLPGVALSQTSGFGSFTQLRLRGAEANHTLVLIDGVEANDPAAGDEFDFASLTAYDVERIELVSGPQSALWGSDALAGVINITTRAPSETLGIELYAEGGSYGATQTGLSLRGGNERLRNAASISWFDTDGQSAAAAGSENDSYRNLNFSGRSTLALTDQAELFASVRYNDDAVDIDGTDFATGLPGDTDAESERELAQFSLGGRVNGDRVSHQLRTTWLDSERAQLSGGGEQSAIAATKLGAYYQSTIQLGRDADRGRQRLTLGIDWERETFDQTGTATPFGDPNQAQDRRNIGWVAEYLTTPTDALTLSAALRFDDNSAFEDVLTYRGTASYRLPKDQTRLRASFGTAQKAPTFVDLFGFFPDSFAGNPALKPETSTGYELAVQHSFGAGSYVLDLAWFDQDLENEINGFAFDPATFLFTAQNLDGTSRRQGVELRFNATLDSQTRLYANASYIDSSVDAANGGSLREVRRPQTMASINLDRTWLDDRLGANLNLSYTGEQNDQVFPPPSFAASTRILDAYTLINLALRYQVSPALSLTARVDNLLDEANSNIVGFRGVERAVYFGLRWRPQR